MYILSTYLHKYLISKTEGRESSIEEKYNKEGPTTMSEEEEDN